MAQLGAVELGGTKTFVATGTVIDDLSSPLRIDTTDPESTLTAVSQYLESQDLAGVGVASFGPLELRPDRPDYGSIIRTPKEGWEGTDLAEILTARLGTRPVIDTDVNGAALGEREWGAAVGLDNVVYLTVGTGIGGGVLVSGRPVHGAPHPEVGHTVVVPFPGDDHAGSCPFHGRCVEGMASGPSFQARFGRPPEDLLGREREEAVDLAAYYVAQGLRNVVYAVAPERIVVGGGVSKLPGFHEKLRSRLSDELAGYPGVAEHMEEGFVVPPGLGDLSGLAGALVLARRT